MTAGRADPSFSSWLITNIINVASDVLGGGGGLIALDLVLCLYQIVLIPAVLFG